ncbi:hypothetical protein TNCV_2812461 [Trichonephila clavipes]|nr:hypothetical protein TNCV_2812461 [Trichonephila clavipes]
MDSLSKEKESEHKNEETKLIRNDFAHYVGTPIDADLREQILKLDPIPTRRQDKRSKGNGCAIQHDFVLLTVSLTSIENLRNHFAKERKNLLVWLRNGLSPRSLKKKRDRKVRQFFDDFKADEKLQDRERLFEVDVFKANVDIITTQLKNRFESMNGIYKSFSFLSPKNIVSTANDLSYKEASNFQKVYSLDLSSEFPNQIKSLKAVFSEELIKLNSIKEI